MKDGLCFCCEAHGQLPRRSTTWQGWAKFLRNFATTQWKFTPMHKHILFYLATKKNVVMRSVSYLLTSTVQTLRGHNKQRGTARWMHSVRGGLVLAPAFHTPQDRKTAGHTCRAPTPDRFPPAKRDWRGQDICLHKCYTVQPEMNVRICVNPARASRSFKPRLRLELLVKFT